MKKWLISFFITALVLAGCTEPQDSSLKETNNVENAPNNNVNLSKEKQENQNNDINPNNETTKQKDSSVDQSAHQESSGSTQTTYEKQGDNNSTSADKVSNYPTYEATIISVTDGDTFRASVNNSRSSIEKYRLNTVDSPESVKRGVEIQPFSIDASNYTKNILKPGTKVLIEQDVQERDRYGRLLAYVYVNGKMLNEILLEKGLARVAVFPPNTRYVDEFRGIQDKARQQQLGIWSIEGYVGNKGFNTNAKGLTSSNTSLKSHNSVSDNSQPNKSGSSSYSKQETNSTTSTNKTFKNNPADDMETNTSCKGKIKGNANSKIYHLPEGAYYDKTVDNIVWFCTEQDAQKQGYRKSQR
ncbi:thermonuclease family protein [Priestia aryabhattai]